MLFKEAEQKIMSFFFFFFPLESFVAVRKAQRDVAMSKFVLLNDQYIFQ